jgi:hypothetical protein
LWLRGKEECGGKRDGIYVPYSTKILTLEVLRTSPISICDCSSLLFQSLPQQATINMGSYTPLANEKTYKLSNGIAIPAVGFGTFANEGSRGETYKVVTHALETGYRHLDYAWFYQNEGEVSDAVHDFLSQNPHVTRQDLFICTKVWQHLHEPAEVRWSFENSLKKLRMEHIDAFLVHWPIAAQADANHMPKLGADGRYIIKHDLTENPPGVCRGVM